MLNVKVGQVVVIKDFGGELSYEAVVTKTFKHCFVARGIKFDLQHKMSVLGGKQFFAAFDEMKYVEA